MALIVKKHKVEFLDEYLRVIEQYSSHDSVLFRGQAEDWDLLPKLARVERRIGVKDPLELEEKLLGEFRRHYRSFYDGHCEDNWDLMCLAQHHGLPTRFLDWTTNALAALWFAVGEEKQSQSMSYVYAYFPQQHDFVELDKCVTPQGIGHTMFLQPTINNARVLAQSGYFSVHRYYEDYGFVAFDAGVILDGTLLKIGIPHAKRWVFRYDLDRCGVNRMTLFPDLDGLCANIQWSQTCYKDEKGKRRSKVKRKNEEA